MGKWSGVGFGGVVIGHITYLLIDDLREEDMDSAVCVCVCVEKSVDNVKLYVHLEKHPIPEI